MADVMVSGGGAEVVLARQTLIRLLDLAFPGPDDPEPSGPAGPISGPSPDPWRIALAGILERLEWVLLNPQPLPPKERAVIAARVMIAGAIETFETAEAVAADSGERALAVIDSRIRAILDDFCGTPPHPPRPFPYPWGGVLDGGEPISTAELLAASVQFQKAADAYADRALNAPFQNAADQLREAGLGALAEA